MKKQKITTKEDAVKLAKRCFENAKETLNKTSIKYDRYEDSKYVREASAMAYLAALQSIDSYLLKEGISPDNRLLFKVKFRGFIDSIVLERKLYDKSNCFKCTEVRNDTGIKPCR